MDNHETKALTGTLHIKSAERGLVEAVVSTLNVVDHDGDVILPGAIRNGSSVGLSAYSHDVITEGKPPAGKGIVTVTGAEAVFRGRYFLETERGRDAFATVKALGEDGQWSIAFPKNVRTAPMTNEWRAKGAQRLIAGLDLLEVSAVFQGANPFTRTVSVKRAEDDDTQATLRQIRADWERREAWIKQWDEQDRMRGGMPLVKCYPHLERAIKYGCEVLRLTPPDIPPMYAVPPEAIPGAWGVFSPKDFALYVSYGLDDENAASVLFHELGHAADYKWRGDMTESSAEATQAILTKGWRDWRTSIADYAQKEELRAIARRWTT